MPQGGDPAPIRLVYRPSGTSPVAPTILPFAKPNEAGALLVDNKGRPVWPVAEHSDQGVLEDIAILFGSKAVHTPANKVNEYDWSGRNETVVGIGDLSQEVRLYAHLTGRRPSLVATAADLSIDTLPAVIIHCSPRLDPSLLQLLSLNPWKEQATGVVWGRDRAELRRQILVSTCAATLAGPVGVRRLDLIGPAKHVSPSNISRNVLRQQMNEGVGLLSILAHSNGVCQPCGSNAVLCPLVDEPKSLVDAEYGPECNYTSNCYRQDKPQSEALTSGRLIAPADIAARVVMSSGCSIVFPGNNAVDSAWAILPQLATNPRIGAFLGVAGLSYFAPEPVERELTKVLASGVPVGRAVAQLEENPTIAAIGFHLLLFGDPRVRAAPPITSFTLRDTASAFQSRDEVASGTAVVENSHDSGALGLLRNLAFVRTRHTRALEDVTARRLVECVSTVEEHRDQSDAPDYASIRELYSAVFEHLATTIVRLFEGWTKDVMGVEQGDLQKCPCCGWPIRPRRFLLYGGGQRDFLDCPACIDVLDAPVEAQHLPYLKFPAVHLASPLRVSRAAAGVFLVGNDSMNTKYFPWPHNEDGFLVEDFWVDPDLLPQGPSRIYAVLIDDLDIMSVAAPVRRQN